MAVTGLIFVGYVAIHAYGNLMVLGGADKFNAYAHHLRTFGEPMLPYEGLLWVVRVVLLASLALHAYSALTLWSRANGARGSRYAVKKNLAAMLEAINRQLDRLFPYTAVWTEPGRFLCLSSRFLFLPTLSFRLRRQPGLFLGP